MFADGAGAARPAGAPRRPADPRRGRAAGRERRPSPRPRPAAATCSRIPAGLAAEAVQVVKLPRRPAAAEARLAGAAIAGFNGSVPLTVLAGGQARIAEVALGLALRAYDFNDYRTPGGRGAGAEPGGDASRSATRAPPRRPSRRSRRRPRGCSSPATWSASRRTCSTTTEFAERLTGAARARRRGRGAGRARARGARDAHAARGRAGLGEPVEGRGDAVEGRRRRRAVRAGRQGRGLRHRRHLDQAGRRHGGDDDGHGRRRASSPG